MRFFLWVFILMNTVNAGSLIQLGFFNKWTISRIESHQIICHSNFKETKINTNLFCLF